MAEATFPGGLLPDHEHRIAVTVEDHLGQLRSARASYPLMRRALEPTYETAKCAYDRFQLERAAAASAGDSPRERRPRHAMPLSKTTAYHHIIRDYENAKRGIRLLPQQLLVQMVAHHDAFLGRLVRVLFELKPELMRDIERTIKLSDLDSLATIEEVRDQLIESEISSVLHKGHASQLQWLGNRLHMSLNSDPELIARFVEITQRRHLYAHTDGVVTNQYVNACLAHGLVPEAAVGETLAIDDRYLERAYRTLYEIAVKLSQVTWRKVFPQELAKADGALSSMCYSLLVFEEFELARTLLTFAVKLPEHSEDRARRVFVVNLAQSHKWLKESKACVAVLGEEDWSACEDAFVLARAVLEEDYEQAKHLMLAVAQGNDIERAAFDDWPLFRSFRSTTEFAEVYQQLYGDPASRSASRTSD